MKGSIGPQGDTGDKGYMGDTGDKVRNNLESCSCIIAFYLPGVYWE